MAAVVALIDLLALAVVAALAAVTNSPPGGAEVMGRSIARRGRT